MYKKLFIENQMLSFNFLFTFFFLFLQDVFSINSAAI